MNAAEYRIVTDFENGLSIGDKVNVCWTNCGNVWDGIGTVAKINAKSINVTLTEPVGDECDYPAGMEIQVPRITAIRRWSVNNRVEPLGGYQPVENSS